MVQVDTVIEEEGQARAEEAEEVGIKINIKVAVAARSGGASMADSMVWPGMQKTE